MSLEHNLNQLSNIISAFADERKEEILEELLDKGLEESRKIVEREHNVTGRLLTNLYGTKIGKNAIEFKVHNNGMMTNWNGNRVNYAIFVYFGAKAHKIKGRELDSPRYIRTRKPFYIDGVGWRRGYTQTHSSLRWGGSSGSYFFAKEVKHPGIQADPFFKRGAEKAVQNVLRSFE